jgi:hypothetical protein
MLKLAPPHRGRRVRHRPAPRTLNVGQHLRKLLTSHDAPPDTKNAFHCGSPRLFTLEPPTGDSGGGVDLEHLSRYTFAKSFRTVRAPRPSRQ